ncbi:MAG: hypothetical protein KDH93_25770 [Rhodoferax sp.]|nr:hypothetical protein [Rhodoferax sp.]MCB2008444.1 hypothetical protein [Rhodoferax sp.]MCB2029046.1 hypothetical protein [Rhodoferax sp.]MCB2039492.1 hypothetical protein [Rhodoferax sp.]MCP5263608.1 hypothetical protein [Rhodoferax sp.]
MQTWTDTVEHTLTRANLALLLDNRIPAIRVPGFADAAECQAFAAAAKAGRMQYYNVSDRIGYIGLAQFQYRWTKTKAEFLADVPQAQADVQAVFDAARFNPLQRVIALLRSHWDAPVDIAHEDDKPYFAGIVRSTTDKIDLHVDWAPVNSPDYAIGAIDGQLGWNFFAEELQSGGQTHVYNHPWDPRVNAGEIPVSYGLDRALTQGATSFTYNPTAGDVVIFNTRNPHEIAAGTPRPGGSRVSIGSFIGRMPDRSLVLWA